MSYRKNMRKSGNSWQKRAEFLTVLIPIKQYGFFLKFIVKWYGKSQKECFWRNHVMKISTKGRYALRLMLDLAMNGKENFVPIRSVSERQEISEKY